MAPILSPVDTSLRFTWRGFAIEIGDGERVREAATRIRHEVFIAELGGSPRSDGREQDEYDDSYQHLLVSHATTGEPVGACRLISSTMTSRFYSAAEFRIDPFLALPGTKVELGRVCLRAAWRNNLALAALGRGVGAFLHRQQAEWVFGCSSVMTTDTRLAAVLSLHLARLAEGRSLAVTPRPAYRLPASDAQPGLPAAAMPDDAATIDRLVPPLLRLYLRAGAALGTAPALDHAFGCLDFFTAVSLNDHRASILGRYVPC